LRKSSPPTAKKGSSSVRDEIHEELSSDEDVNPPKRLAGKESLIIPEPPSLDLTILKNWKRGLA
jgi:hypothetical protein